jgi:hypothetical protein
LLVIPKLIDTTNAAMPVRRSIKAISPAIGGRQISFQLLCQESIRLAATDAT